MHLRCFDLLVHIFIIQSEAEASNFIVADFQCVMKDIVEAAVIEILCHIVQNA